MDDERECCGKLLANNMLTNNVESTHRDHSRGFLPTSPPELIVNR